MEELLWNLFGSILETIAGSALAEPFEKSPRPLLASLGWAFYGLFAGFISLLALPDHLFADQSTRVACLLLGPFMMGALVAVTKIWSKRRISAVERFIYGYFFAVVLMGVRFACVQ